MKPILITVLLATIAGYFLSVYPEATSVTRADVFFGVLALNALFLHSMLAYVIPQLVHARRILKELPRATLVALLEITESLPKEQKDRVLSALSDRTGITIKELKNAR